MLLSDITFIEFLKCIGSIEKSCLAWFLGDIFIIQNLKIWVIDDENWKQNFNIFSF